MGNTYTRTSFAWRTAREIRPGLAYQVVDDIGELGTAHGYQHDVVIFDIVPRRYSQKANLVVVIVNDICIALKQIDTSIIPPLTTPETHFSV
ncbi:hypothetical protein BFJ63_vAg15455 [Fusarium oxysporum f. sp. narcissi]|uniref:Uncharacterized protein n=1 Tax=Fusarium oxysporum f. sp. narcissi TaxID=451672 RepID=A0A4Q2V9Z8_FUSOX|nr:hypothetical protein BFJ63_vAg15455 [Fusarium oxysporum f. sp. narcissi]